MQEREGSGLARGTKYLLRPGSQPAVSEAPPPSPPLRLWKERTRPRHGHGHGHGHPLGRVQTRAHPLAPPAKSSPAVAAAHPAFVLPPGPTAEGQLCYCWGSHPIFLESWPKPGTRSPSEPRSEHSLSPESLGPWPAAVHVNQGLVSPDSVPGAAPPGAGAVVASFL